MPSESTFKLKCMKIYTKYGRTPFIHTPKKTEETNLRKIPTNYSSLLHS